MNQFTKLYITISSRYKYILDKYTYKNIYTLSWIKADRLTLLYIQSKTMTKSFYHFHKSMNLYNKS